MKFIPRVLFLLFLLPAIVFAQSKPTASQQASTKGMVLDTGEEIFKASCIGCHGPDGAGQPQAILGFEPPDTFPDFTDCNGSTRERTADWSAIIHEGGPVRAFSEIMPSWKDALTDDQIKKAIGFLRSRCEEKGWPLGELNLPRALFTEKAFPEDEWVLTTTAKVDRPYEIGSALIYEKRIGRKNQLEFSAPFGLVQDSENGWDGGIGDLVLGYKRVIFSLGTSSILSAQAEVSVPTGNKTKGLGTGVTTFETFAMFGQTLPLSSFFQLQSGFELPTNKDRLPNAFFVRGAAGKTITRNGTAGRAWTPMVEILGDRDLVTGVRTNWDAVGEMQVTLSKRQHIRLSVGVRTPINNFTDRSTQVAAYLLWDFFDGSLKAGW